jgi:hypothetical protein
MKRLLAYVAGLAVVCGMAALAQETTPPATGTAPAPSERAQRMAELRMQRMTEAVMGEMDVSRAQHMAGVLHVLVLEEQRNPGIKPMVEKALDSRKVVLQAEMDRLPKFQAFIKATHEGNREAITKARQELGTASQAVETAAKAFVAEVEAIQKEVRAQRAAAQPAAAQPAAAGAATAAPETAK